MPKHAVHARPKKEEYGESSKYMQFLDDQGKSIKPQLNQKAIDKELAG